MKSSKYSQVPDIFLNEDISTFTKLHQFDIAYKRVADAIKQPIKLVLLYGKPGTGKTFLLNKLYFDLKTTMNLLFLEQPCFDECSFYSQILEQLNIDENINNFDNFIFQIRSLNLDNLVILLDEVQLYPNELIEKLRIIADTKLIKFVITVHKSDREDIFMQEYFSTRIWDKVELKNSSFDELETYISKKFIQNSMLDIFNHFSKSNLKKIYKYTSGNLRTVNKLLYKLFQLYEFYEENDHKKIKTTTIENKYIEMAAISTGAINA